MPYKNFLASFGVSPLYDVQPSGRLCFIRTRVHMNIKKFVSTIVVSSALVSSSAYPQAVAPAAVVGTGDRTTEGIAGGDPIGAIGGAGDGATRARVAAGNAGLSTAAITGIAVGAIAVAGIAAGVAASSGGSSGSVITATATSTSTAQ